MKTEYLEPNLKLLCEEYVLIQAWKKTANYIRYHNSFVDTLNLDYVTINLREFISRLQELLKSTDTWKNDPLRIVPAPKSQKWKVRGKKWTPCHDRENTEENNSYPIRPLGHVSIKDQVVATAIMLCLADRVETLQGDTRTEINDQGSYSNIISYGNRLFCDSISGKLHHRWGSSKLYRSYFQDYKTFISRPDIVAKLIFRNDTNKKIYVIHSDIRKFYDCVRPDMLQNSVAKIYHSDDDPKFLALLNSIFNWEWDSRDTEIVTEYEQQSNIDGFSKIALPQGLVASGFFANIVLLDFDNELQAKIGKEISDGIFLIDACRYVDDLHFVVTVDHESPSSSDDIKHQFIQWLNKKLKITAGGLELSEEKSTIIEYEQDASNILFQSKKMKRIQKAISGGFDAYGGVEVLDSITGLIQNQREFKIGDEENFHLIPDVRDLTVARFAARRFLNTFRSVRPLLSDDSDDNISWTYLPELITRTELDQKVKAYAFDLIQKWINDPSNVLLLLIGFDLTPDAQMSKYVLELLRPYISKVTEEHKNQVLDNDTTGSKENGTQSIRRMVAEYCLSAILRAGATQTGMVDNPELSYPSSISLEDYRDSLKDEAVRVLELPEKSVPWYLSQQAFLFLLTYCPAEILEIPTHQEDEEISVHDGIDYPKLIQFFCCKKPDLTDSEFAIFAIMAKRTFLKQQQVLPWIKENLTKDLIEQIYDRDPAFAHELISDECCPVGMDQLSKQTRQDLCLIHAKSGEDSLATIHIGDPVLKKRLRNELSLSYFSVKFLEQWDETKHASRVITPENIKLKLESNSNKRIEEIWIEWLKIKVNEDSADDSTSLYKPPSWCANNDQWRIHLGFLLRFILTGHPDFTQHIYPKINTQTEHIYKPVRSHWYQRLYGHYNGQSAFGDNWLPITDWFEKFLLALLRWPGCRMSEEFDWINEGIIKSINQINNHISTIENNYGIASKTLILPVSVNRPSREDNKRALRACVVQTVIPNFEHFQFNNLSEQNLRLNSERMRQQHRRHLSSALATVEKMLKLRNTHVNNECGNHLDWLILPELAVHPYDVQTHLIPFSLKHRSIILAGLSYEEISKGKPLINSALWIIPEYSEAYGLQIQIRRQGKLHLAKMEKSFNRNCKNLIEGFRPCQWLIEYPWSNESDDPSLSLTATVCYDATDLSLMADLKGQSDILAIPALNKDVGTFDKMAEALHYHMYQYVIVANNGKYGGSNAYFPHHDSYVRQVFHTHGQPQSTVSFLEIKNIEQFLKRKETHVTATRNNGVDESDIPISSNLKYPPAGVI